MNGLMRACARLAMSGFLFASVVCAAANEYPDKPIRLIVGFAPGGGLDLIARVLAKHLTESFGKTILVDNRPGANGIIATEITAKALADGYTLMVTDAPHAINPFVYANVKYDPVRDFAPVSLVTSAPVVLAVHPRVTAQSVKDFISNWYGVVAPAGTPAGIVALLNREIGAAVRSPEVKERFDSALLEAGTNTPREFAAFLTAEATRWSKLIPLFGIKAQ